MCIVHNALPGLATTGPIIACSAGAGLATLLEKKSRRVELAIYVLSRAIESFSLSLMEWKVIPQKKIVSKLRMDIVTFSVACSIILHCYTHERDIFKEKYLNVFDWLYGNFGFEEGKIRHVRSSLLLNSSSSNITSFGSRSSMNSNESSTSVDDNDVDIGSGKDE